MSKVVRLIESIVTWQGEGPDSGVRMLLCRFKRCNRAYSGNACPWCDTNVKMRCLVETEFSLGDLQHEIELNNVGLMITGGEPTFGINLNGTVRMLNTLKYPVANVETNGHQLEKLIESVPSTKKVKYIYSPKLFSQEDIDFSVDLCKKIADNPKVFIKFVYERNNVSDSFLEILSNLNINHRVFLMPEGTTKEKLLENSPIVFDAAETFKFNFSSRNHIIYGFV